MTVCRSTTTRLGDTGLRPTDVTDIERHAGYKSPRNDSVVNLEDEKEKKNGNGGLPPYVEWVSLSSAVRTRSFTRTYSQPRSNHFVC